MRRMSRSKLRLSPGLATRVGAGRAVPGAFAIEAMSVCTLGTLGWGARASSVRTSAIAAQPVPPAEIHWCFPCGNWASKCG